MGLAKRVESQPPIDFWAREAPKEPEDVLCRQHVVRTVVRHLRSTGWRDGYVIGDFGCNDGRTSRWIIDRLGPTVEAIFAVDRNPERIREANELDCAYDVIEYAVDDVRELKTLNFDIQLHVAMSVMVYQHLSHNDMLHANQAVADSLGPSGLFVVAVPHPFEDDIRSHLVEPANRQERTPRFRHKISEYVNGLIVTGFRIEHLQEPTYTAEEFNRFGMLGGPMRIPEYLIIAATKR